MTNIKKTILALIIASATIVSSAQENLSALLPIPQKIECRTGEKAFDLRHAAIAMNDCEDSPYIKEELVGIIEERTGIKVCSSKGKRSIEIVLSEDKGKEEYSIEIDSRHIRFTGGSEAGIFYALKTFDQLLLGDAINSSEGKVAPIHIEDTPRYGYRAVMLDPARHFLPVEDVKQFIDRMACYKYNVLQLHLTDDQGWRIEIKSHPELTEKGAFRNPKGGNNGPDNGYYTQEQIKELIDYAAQRHIEIVPELDIPGHSAAILAAYPELGCPFRHGDAKEIGKVTNMMLCASSEKAYKVYEDIIREVAQLFPSKRIHLGGDEAAVKDNWAQCEECLALMRSAGYEKPSQLMNIFFGRMLEYVRNNGKEAILWCELDNMWPPANDYLFPYPKDVTLVTWRNGLTPKCIELTRNNGHKLIMAPGEHTYLDYPQWQNDLPEFNNWGMPVTTLQKAYELDPGYGLKDSEQKHIIGVMATLWAEAIKDINRVNYMFYPRGLAIAEAAWSGMEQRSWESFKKRLYPNLYELMKQGISFRVPFETGGK